MCKISEWTNYKNHCLMELSDCSWSANIGEITVHA